MVGKGELWTWIGALLFVIFMILFTFISNDGINRQIKILQDIVSESQRADRARDDV